MNRTLIISGLLVSVIALTACDRVFQRPADTSGTGPAATEAPDAAVAEPSAQLPVRPESASSGAVIDWEAARRDLSLRVHKEYRGVTEGELRVRALEQALRSADQLLLSTRRSRQAGVRTALDELNAEQQRATVRRDLMQARYLSLVSRLRLYALSGMAPEQAIAEVAVAFGS